MRRRFGRGSKVKAWTAADSQEEKEMCLLRCTAILEFRILVCLIFQQHENENDQAAGPLQTGP